MHKGYYSTKLHFFQVPKPKKRRKAEIFADKVNLSRKNSQKNTPDSLQNDKRLQI
jgi:hypothetical protein